MVWLEFFDSTDSLRNIWQVTQQVAMDEGKYRNRYDVTILCNGLPVVQIELKRRGLEMKEAFNQIQRYQKHTFWSGHGLFHFVQLFVISNGVNTKYYANARKQSFKQTFYWAHEDNKTIRELTPFADAFLNREHLGTMEHRFSCPKTCPQTGWPKPPAIASKPLRRISDRRSNILRSHGMLAVRLPPRPHHQDGQFAWLAAPDHNDPGLTNATWYCDGSMLNGKWKPLRITGFGIAVVSAEGSLIGHGLGWPPSWVTTAAAAAAESWALSIVLQLVRLPPKLTTDCLALLQTAKEGTQKATHHSKPLARIWRSSPIPQAGMCLNCSTTTCWSGSLRTSPSKL